MADWTLNLRLSSNGLYAQLVIFVLYLNFKVKGVNYMQW